jgi:hypothetical protein
MERSLCKPGSNPSPLGGSNFGRQVTIQLRRGESPLVDGSPGRQEPQKVYFTRGKKAKVGMFGPTM